MAIALSLLNPDLVGTESWVKKKGSFFPDRFFPDRFFRLKTELNFFNIFTSAWTARISLSAKTQPFEIACTLCVGALSFTNEKGGLVFRACKQFHIRREKCSKN